MQHICPSCRPLRSDIRLLTDCRLPAEDIYCRQCGQIDRRFYGLEKVLHIAWCVYENGKTQSEEFPSLTDLYPPAPSAQLSLNAHHPATDEGPLCFRKSADPTHDSFPCRKETSLPYTDPPAGLCHTVQR